VGIHLSQKRDLIELPFMRSLEKLIENNQKYISGCFLMINYSAEIAPKPQELRQVPQSIQTLSSIL